jgi:hypothetical protein
MRIYEDLQVARVRVDGQVLNGLLLNCTRYQSATTVALGLDLLQKHLGFPDRPAAAVPPAPSKPSPIPMDVTLLLTCIRFLSKTSTPMMASRFLALHLDTPGLSTETTLTNLQAWTILMGVLVAQEEFDQAWELVTHHMPEPFKYETSLRLAAGALWRNRQQGREEGNAVWLERATAHSALRPERASIPLLTYYLKVAVMDPAMKPEVVAAFLVRHYLTDLKASERKVSSFAGRYKPGAGRKPEKRSEYSEAIKALRLFALVDRLLHHAPPTRHLAGFSVLLEQQDATRILRDLLQDVQAHQSTLPAHFFTLTQELSSKGAVGGWPRAVQRQGSV